MDFSTGNSFTTQTIQPSSVLKSDGTDQTEKLIARDTIYSHLAGDEEIKFSYAVIPSKDTSSISSYFLVSGGYYHSLKQIAGKTNYLKLNEFRKKGMFDKYSREKYGEVIMASKK